MQKLSDIKIVIKILEQGILEDTEVILGELKLPIKDNIENYITSRKVLLWVIQTQKRNKKQDNSKKLEDFDIQKPT